MFQILLLSFFQIHLLCRHLPFVKSKHIVFCRCPTYFHVPFRNICFYAIDVKKQQQNFLLETKLETKICCFFYRNTLETKFANLNMEKNETTKKCACFLNVNKRKMSIKNRSLKKLEELTKNSCFSKKKLIARAMN